MFYSPQFPPDNACSGDAYHPPKNDYVLILTQIHKDSGDACTFDDQMKSIEKNIFNGTHPGGEGTLRALVFSEFVPHRPSTTTSTTPAPKKAPDDNEEPQLAADGGTSPADGGVLGNAGNFLSVVSRRALRMLPTSSEKRRPVEDEEKTTSRELASPTPTFHDLLSLLTEHGRAMKHDVVYTEGADPTQEDEADDDNDDNDPIERSYRNYFAAAPAGRFPVILFYRFSSGCWKSGQPLQTWRYVSLGLWDPINLVLGLFATFAVGFGAIVAGSKCRPVSPRGTQSAPTTPALVEQVNVRILRNIVVWEGGGGHGGGRRPVWGL